MLIPRTSVLVWLPFIAGRENDSWRLRAMEPSLTSIGACGISEGITWSNRASASRRRRRSKSFLLAEVAGSGAPR